MSSPKLGTPIKCGPCLFCEKCKNLLPPTTGDPNNILECDTPGCGLKNRDMVFKPIYTESSDFPSPLRQKLSVIQQVERHKISTERIDSNADCPSCKKTGIRYTELQTRGADEGSTILYNCDCGHRWSINN